jgi:hypothetical protein
MKKTLALAAAVSLLAVSGALAFSAQDPLVGRTARAVAADGSVSVVHFGPNGTAHLEAGGQHINGTWEIDGDQLCFVWPGQPRECWPFDPSVPVGQTVEVTSDQGDTAQVTWDS